MTSSAADLVLAARRLMSGRRDVLTLAYRPGSPVVHLYVGPVTPSGRWVPRTGRTVCHARTRRLSVLERDLGLLDHGRRVCHRCTARLSAHCRRVVQPVSRDQWLTAYRGTQLRDLVLMLAISSTVDETHRIGFIASLLFGPAPIRRPREFSARQAYYDLHAAILTRRRSLAAALRTPEEIEADRRAREVAAHNDALVRAARARAVRVGLAVDRKTRGGYLTPDERELIGMTG